uniref:Uncharacterized protein n=1 Tax=Anguilla anguilla TaxID=7936 RepID=A0A0E9SUD5_ANGAN
MCSTSYTSQKRTTSSYTGAFDGTIPASLSSSRPKINLCPQSFSL